MFEVRQTREFRKWHAALRDRMAAEIVADRIARLRGGLLGDAKFFGGIGELRINYGPGYRLYFLQQNTILIVLLCGGDKSTQDRDLRAAKVIAKELKDAR